MRNTPPNCGANEQYTIAQAAEVLWVSDSTIERAIYGYKWKYKGEPRYKEPVMGYFMHRELRKPIILGKDINRYWSGK